MTDEPIDAQAQAKLYTKLAEVTKAVQRVPKSGHNAFHNYKYVTEEDLTLAVRDELSSRNVMVIPSVASVEQRPIKTQKGKDSTVTTVHMAFTFVDGDSGAMHQAKWAGAGEDPADKGLYKAYAGAMKYFLMKAFMIPTGDDPERDNRPPAAPEPQIDEQRVGEVSDRISKALAAGLEPTVLSEMFTGAGAAATAINRQAVADLTVSQADQVVAALDDFLSAPPVDGAQLGMEASKS